MIKKTGGLFLFPLFFQSIKLLAQFTAPTVSGIFIPASRLMFLIMVVGMSFFHKCIDRSVY